MNNIDQKNDLASRHRTVGRREGALAAVWWIVGIAVVLILLLWLGAYAFWPHPAQ